MMSLEAVVHAAGVGAAAWAGTACLHPLGAPLNHTLCVCVSYFGYMQPLTLVASAGQQDTLAPGVS